MGDSAATLVAIGITVPLTVLLIYFGFRHLVARVRDVGEAVETEVARRRQLDTARLRDTESVRSTSAPPTAAPAAAAPDLAAQVFAMVNEQAKRSNDAHKEQIRAHAKRTVPPIDDDGRKTLERSRQARLAIKHIFPPRLPQRGMSYFGGLPIVPEDFDWPTVHNNKGLIQRLNFVAQIDCTDLPPGPARDLLPDKGYLYFFAPLADSFGPDAMHFVTRYLPGKATQRWEPVDMPATAKVEPTDAMDAVVQGARTHFDRVEIEFGWIEEPSKAEVEARRDEGHPHEVAEKIRADKMEAFFGPTVEYDPLLSAHQAPRDALWIPYPGFPANWKTARLIRRLVEHYHREEVLDVAERLKALGEVPEDDPEAQRLKQLQTELSKVGSRMFTPFHPTVNAGLKEYDAPPDGVKQGILEFLEEIRVNGIPSSKEQPYWQHQLPAVLNQWLAYAALHGAEGGLKDSEGAEHIPPEVTAALTHRHATRKHHMLGEGEVVQVAADEMQERYVLLIQLAPDPALNWTIGEMGPMQYWITPEDLAAKRFENTVLTIEAY